eukprot:gnl/MRDRNA2_/MRDRNA2_47096_c0_seq1.p1 gnl/MRDRNA2_/MRDRNA2_47096_c0~~gnl/MRDRNA2_/MRDRNA2_47096_c0_seq1.p1  ORF type:complete len:134 (+),score=29.01 gnl/MRDRNA2_/MRDRNA2_47096_c0_seq1:28-402(+)
MLALIVVILVVLVVFLCIATRRHGAKDTPPENTPLYMAQEVGTSDVTFEIGGDDLNLQVESQRSRRRPELPGCLYSSSSESETTVNLEERMARFDQQCRRLEQQMAIAEVKEDDLSSKTSAADQ